MATTKKKPSAAQLRARAKFAATMKSGGFGKAKKSTRRKNPVSRSGASGRGLSTNLVDADFNRQTRSLSGVGRSGRSGIDMGARVQGGMLRTRRALNPIAPPAKFAVHIATVDGRAGRFLFACSTKPIAVEMGKAYANAHHTRVMIVGKAR